MRSIVIPLILVSCAFPVIGGVMKIASDVTSGPHTHHFANLDAHPLWTTRPVKVDTSAQNFERVAGFAVAEIQSKKPSVTQVAETALQANTSADRDLARVDEWCSSRYQSYDTSSGTYQPYGGGSRRKCVPPMATLSNFASTVGDVSTVHAQWCSQRFSSYDVTSDTYQPFTGPRRSCVSPHTAPGDVVASSE